MSRIKKRAILPKNLWNPPKEIAPDPLDIFLQQAYIFHIETAMASWRAQDLRASVPFFVVDTDLKYGKGTMRDGKDL